MTFLLSKIHFFFKGGALTPSSLYLNIREKKTKNAKFPWVDPLGYKKCRGQDYSLFYLDLHFVEGLLQE